MCHAFTYEIQAKVINTGHAVHAVAPVVKKVVAPVVAAPVVHAPAYGHAVGGFGYGLPGGVAYSQSFGGAYGHGGGAFF